MPHNHRTSNLNRWLLYVLVVLSVSMFIIWPFFAAKPIIEYVNRTYVDLYRLPELWSFLSLMSIAMGPPVLVVFGSAAYYTRWHSSHRSQLVKEQLSRLSSARLGLQSAVASIENFEHELRIKTEQTEKLELELSSLKLLNAETAVDLQKKLHALQLMNRRNVWLERGLSFGIGVVSSLVASYAWQYVLSSQQ